MDYINDHPDTLATISAETYAELIAEGQLGALREMAADPLNREMISTRIDTILTQANGHLDNLQWGDKHELQVMLTITGHNSPDNIDGIIGTDTNNAAAKYQQERGTNTPEIAPGEPPPLDRVEIPVKPDDKIEQNPPPQPEPVHPPQRPERPAIARHSGLSQEDVNNGWRFARLQKSISKIHEARELIKDDPQFAS